VRADSVEGQGSVVWPYAMVGQTPQQAREALAQLYRDGAQAAGAR
jgi:hypothetical protein